MSTKSLLTECTGDPDIERFRLVFLPYERSHTKGLSVMIGVSQIRFLKLGHDCF